MILNSVRSHLTLLLAVACLAINTQSAAAQSDVTPPPEPAAADTQRAVGELAPGDVSDRETDSEYAVLTQGPVHEAFAAPVDTDFTDGARLYAKAPPEPVNEQPPEMQTLSENLTWIPGYWSWDDDRDDYVWVSGLWRKVPPRRTWTPGFWSQVGSGYRWTSGFWTGATTALSSSSLPMPPRSIDNGPSVPPPSDDYFWVPGHWEYAGSDYRWQSGFWGQQQDDWVWQPTCYVYTQQGYRLVDGYWDYLPSSRGQLYAPVHFYGSVYGRPNYVYRPRYPLANTASLLVRLFARSGYPHYYYGDFYGPSYRSLGYRPWYDFGYGSGYGYQSPLLGYYDWKYRRSGIDFVSSMQRYESHQHPKHGKSIEKQLSGKQSLPGAAFERPSTPKPDKFSPSLDDVVRSGRVAIPQGDKSFKLKSPKGSNSFNADPARLGRSTTPPWPSGAGLSKSPKQDAKQPSLGFQGAGRNPGQFEKPKQFRASNHQSIQSGPMIPQRSQPSFKGNDVKSFDRGSVPNFDRGKSPSMKFDRGGGAKSSGNGASRGSQKSGKSNGGGKGKK